MALSANSNLQQSNQVILILYFSQISIGRMYNPYLGIPIVVKDSHLLNKDDSSCITNEVKKLGLLIDRYVDLELRVGDTLVIYISRGSS